MYMRDSLVFPKFRFGKPAAHSALRGMQKLRVLIASSDRTAAKRIEGLLLDVCFERADVECRCSPFLVDVENSTRQGWPTLTILSPDNVIIPSGQRGFRQAMAESLLLIENIRK